MTRTDYVHLHVHSEGSFLDGLASPRQYAVLAAQMGQPALALTDHANLTQAPIFYKECKKVEVEPVLGFEAYFVNDFESVKNEKDANRAHVTVLARGAAGYSVLSELNTATYKQYYYKPLLDRNLSEQLGKDSQHLTVLSGCAGSQLSRLILDGKEEEAIEDLIWWRETFPNYYIEIMHHNTSFDKKLNEGLLNLAVRYNIPWVVTNDPHYAVPDDARHQDALLAIQMGKDIDDPDRMRFDGEGYYLKSRAEMYHTFKQAGYDPLVFRAGAYNALKISRDSVTNVKAWDSKIWQIPKFPDVPDEQTELKRLAYEGLRRINKRDDPVYVERTKLELKAIRQTKIAGFLLITRELDEFARSVGIRVGPGRGSICGSLVAYLANIHNVDPIRYKLSFERFLNPARPKMPDIDTDYQAQRRQEVIDHAIEKYGSENTMAVAALGKMRVTAAFNSLSKAYGFSFVDAQRLNKAIIESEDEDGNLTYLLPDEIISSHPEMTATLNRLAGVTRSISAHPAGLIIADPKVNIRKQVPEMFIPSSKRWVASYDKKAIESMGLMKQDLLGLRCLDTISEAVRLIKQRQGIDIEPDDWVPDEEEGDAQIYRMLARGHTSGVFQMEGIVNQRGCRDVKPKEFEDLVSITSLYRTGPIAAGYPAQFINNRNIGVDSISYIHPLLKDILELTWGVILYQEQVMDIGRVLAGFDMVLVDEIKEAIKDKSSDEMDRLRPVFIKGCKKTNNISESTAAKVWDIIEGYAGYGYNRSHAVAYTMLTYQTARLKRMYPVEFYAALLRTVENSKDNGPRREGYMRDAILAGAKILPADINVSDGKAVPTPLPEEGIRFGLTDLKGIGIKQAEKLLQGRPAAGYTSLEQVVAAANNVGVVRTLTLGSALESIGVPGDEKETERLLNWTFRDDMVKWRRKFADVVILPNEDGEQVDVVGIIVSAVKGKTKTDKPYMTWKIRWSVTEAFDIRMWSDCESLWDLLPGSVVRIKGVWQSRWLNITVNNSSAIRVIHRAKT